MSRLDYRGHLTAAALTGCALLAFDIDDLTASPAGARLLVIHVLVVAAAGLFAAWCTRVVLRRWAMRRELAEAVAVEESYRLGWAAATAAEEPPSLRLVSAPRRR